MGFYLAQTLSGLASASGLFLVAAGLTLIFGVSRIVNFAHGALYMLGAFVAWTLAPRLGFALAAAGAALSVAALGALVEWGLMRRIYRAPELFQLLATFALALMIEDLVPLLWGPADRLGQPPSILQGAVALWGQWVPRYDLALIGLGLAVALGLWGLLYRTRFGILLRAATLDRDMVAALGVDQARLFWAVFVLGAGLAGLGGAVAMPRVTLTHGMDMTVIVEAFAVVVIGGMGSVPGALLASVLLGVSQAFAVLVLPRLTLALPFVIMAGVLALRPQGLLGRQTAEAPPPPVFPEPGRRWRMGLAGALVVLAVLPFALGPFAQGPFLQELAAEIAVSALFAASLQFLLGPAGLISFGHAAYFGLGAYGAALAVKALGMPMLPALAAALVAGALGGVLFGWFCVRLSGVSLAMLTLAFAEILHAGAAQGVALTGGDDGLLGLWPDAWAARPWAYYALALGVLTLALGFLGRLHASPFGLALRAGRDHARRAEAIGIDVGATRWAAFAISGALAGLAGGLYTFLKGSVFPESLSIATSVDGLVMVLWGGVNALLGAVAGAGLYHGLHTLLAALTQWWKLVLGAVVLVTVLALPGGLTAGRMREGEGP